MEFTDVFYSLENEKQFWIEVDELVSTVSNKLEVEVATSRLISFFLKYGKPYLITEIQLQTAAEKLIRSPLFKLDKNTVQTIMLDCFFFMEDIHIIKFIVVFFLLDIRLDDKCVKLLIASGFFGALVQAIIRFRDPSEKGMYISFRYGLCLMYHLCRSQRLPLTDLVTADESFLKGLLATAEFTWAEEDVENFSMCMHLLLSLNEQFMLVKLASTGVVEIQNGVMNLLSASKVDTGVYNEGLVFMLNRERDPRTRMLILKQLYLLFTTPKTYEIFYTNDLNVLIDVLIREINDIPNELAKLRYAYLQVLLPLLQNTQVRLPPHYKTKQIIRAIHNLLISHSQGINCVDASTVEVLNQILQIPWLREEANKLTVAPV
ncbi:cytoskeletal protein [Schizosaccharomyces cryophilus OY26]|uniref:Cytoskeletal protein n=1 Tax=Schizosaccharomyces cryophilus (strain OY26 / ATCC MYA-4695 / CBS 11777 / NBRC 106824 / NRRL Y48691) TaxID=653667 RepID=S9X730_SCHCR|nr:cytoskeletal protein [Schizosaccharomyces cryophilus OY26]EPY52882.1 cytoskeletal protein [Schizosaccharomyces cryophilus OY26]